jgi:predicted ATP-dependent serine protease
MKYTFTKIALKELQSNIPYILLFSFLSFFCLRNSYAQNIPSKTRVQKDSILLNKSIDTIKTPSSSASKGTIQDIITHTAEKYILQNAKKNQIILYDNAHVTYQDIDLKAGSIIIDNNTNTLLQQE